MSVIVITGPTGTGKSALGVQLAKQINGEIVSADSMQIYKFMDIGTAKPTNKEMDGIPHHMIDIIHPSEDYSVAKYINDASACIDDIIKRGKRPIIVGGTGLYIDSLLSGRNFSARGDDKLRSELEDKYDKIGSDAMMKKLHSVDPESAAKLKVNDKRRIVRALEIFITTGKTITQHDLESKAIPPRYDSTIFALTYSDRAKLYEKIEQRVDDMIFKGLKKEVESLLEMGISQKSTSMQAIGYKEFSAVITKNVDIDYAIDKIKMESRRYAKRQLTWLRRNNQISWITWEDTPDFSLGMHMIHGATGGDCGSSPQ